MDPYFQFDRENVELIAKGEVQEVERRLLQSYELATDGQDRARRIRAISALAHFYSLPFKEDLVKAEHYFRERLAMLPNAESALALVTFFHYILADPRKTVEAAGVVRSFTGRATPSDLRFLYAAVAMEGHAHIVLGEENKAVLDLEELLAMATSDPDSVPFGDEFNFVEQLVKRRLARRTCWQLVEIAHRRVRSVEYREKFEKLLSSQTSDYEGP